MGPELFVVDAFTARPFAGNPAAVVLLDAPAPAEWMQSVAAEMNLSETAFVHGASRQEWDLRWFTPVTEVDLCGHATLASAHVLWSADRAGAAPLVFRTRSGALGAERGGERITLDFPATPARPQPAPPGLIDALGATPIWTGANDEDLLAILPSPREVVGLTPDLAGLARLATRGLIVSAEGGDDCDFTSRFFGPAVGIPEDPVTGSAHCTLAPFWAERLGRTTLSAHQASARGGRLEVTVDGDRVRISGAAVTVVRGHLHVGPPPA